MVLSSLKLTFLPLENGAWETSETTFWDTAYLQRLCGCLREGMIVLVRSFGQVGEV